MAHDLPKTGADGAPLSVVHSEHDLEKQKEKAQKEARDFAKEQITYERARIAIEKMQLSWLRKAMIVSALGMTLYKVFEAEVGRGGGLVLGFLTAREIGLFMLLVGFVSLVLLLSNMSRHTTRSRSSTRNTRRCPRRFLFI